MNHDKLIYLIYTGNFNACTGGYIYNRKLVENLKSLGVEVKLIQLPDKQFVKHTIWLSLAHQVLSPISLNSILLIDSLAFGSNYILWKKICHSHYLVPIIHLPLFLNLEIDHSNPSVKQKEIELLKLSHHIIVTSPYSRYVLKREGINVDRVSVIIPGVDPIRKKQFYRNVPEQLLCVSNISRSKNQLLLLTTLNLLKQYPWTLHLAGSCNSDPDYLNRLRGFIRENNLYDRVIFHGLISGKELQNFYLQSDLFLFPSIFETYGMVIPEALMAGLPVFAFESEGIEFNFNHYPLQLFNDQNSLYNLLWDVLLHKGFYSEMTESLKNIDPFPNWEMTAKLFINTLHL